MVLRQAYASLLIKCFLKDDFIFDQLFFALFKELVKLWKLKLSIKGEPDKNECETFFCIGLFEIIYLKTFSLSKFRIDKNAVN